MPDPFIVQDGPPVDFKGIAYVPIRFTRAIPKDDFTALARSTLHAHDCIFSKPLKRWYCPEAWLEGMQRQAENFVDGIPQQEDLGDELARVVQGK